MVSFGGFRKLGIGVVVIIATLGLVACGGADKYKSGSGSTKSTSSSDNQSQRNQNNQSQQNQNNQSQQNQNNPPNPVPATPNISIIRCSISATSNVLGVSASSTSGTGIKGVVSVYATTYNNQNAAITTDLWPLGPDTGNGDQWQSARVAFGSDYKSLLTVTAKYGDGTTKSLSSTVPCA